MVYGIAIMGLNGCGKSTLAHEISKRLNYFEMDVEDYYFPEQRESRKAILEHQYDVECEYLGGASLFRSSFKKRSAGNDSRRYKKASTVCYLRCDNEVGSGYFSRN